MPEKRIFCCTFGTTGSATAGGESSELPTSDVIRDDTLIKLLQSERVPMSKIMNDYPGVTGIAKVMIGVVPICDSYLEIWPKAFKSYNVLIPNLGNAPFTPFRVGPGYGRGTELQGLGMYVVSKSAQCPYCTAHTCSFALRRGNRTEVLLDSLQENPNLRADQRATVAVGRSLGRTPCRLTSDEKEALIAEVGDKVTETIVFGMFAMGYLNKVMDALGVELENKTYLETKGVIGDDDYAHSKAGVLLRASDPATKPPSKDSFLTMLSLLPKIPSAVKLDYEYTRGVPNTWPEVGEYLQARIGYNFPGLSAISQSFLGKRAKVAIATVLVDNYDVNDTCCTIPVKVIAGLIFAHVTQSKALTTDFEALADVFGVSQEQRNLAKEIAENPSTQGIPASSNNNDDPKTRAYLRLARAIASSPAQVSVDIVNELEEAKLEPKGIVEMVNFIAVAQLLLRLDAFYPREPEC